MNCRICSKTSENLFTAEVLNRYSVCYFHCPECNFIFTEEPYWLEEAYSSAINDSDTGLLQRNLHLARLVSVICFFFFDRKGKYLDYAGGYGLFTRRMRDIGFNFFWNDPYCENLLARGFEADLSAGIKYEALTAFEVFEHLPDPLTAINKMLELSDTVIFSTELFPASKPPEKDWWYYGFGHGQHVAFYSAETLKKIARVTDTNFYSVSGLYILTRKNLNRTLLKLAGKLTSAGLFSFTRKLVSSRTLEDFYYLRSKNQEKRHD